MVRLLGRVKDWNKSIFLWLVNFIISLPSKFKRIWYFIRRKNPPDEPVGDQPSKRIRMLNYAIVFFSILFLLSFIVMLRGKSSFEEHFKEFN